MMILAVGRRKGLELAVRSQQQNLHRLLERQPSDAAFRIRGPGTTRSIVSSQSSSVGENKNQDKSFKISDTQSSLRQHQTGINHHESPPPSRQLRLKVPPKRGIIRAKSPIVNASLYEMHPRTNERTMSQGLSRYGDDDNNDDQPEVASAGFVSDIALHDITAKDVEPSHVFIVEAYYAAKTVDLASLIISDFSNESMKRKYNKDSLVLQLSPGFDTQSISADQDHHHYQQQDQQQPSYVAVYRFGSVIFINVSPRDKSRLLQSVKRYSIEPVATGFEQRDSFGVCVMPDAPRSRVTSEHAVVKKLNLKAVGVISEVMAQSVALDSYTDIVDSLLENFAVVNSKIATTNEMDLDKKNLFKKIAQNNRIFIDLISKLRIKGRSQIAWDQGEYEVVHEGMTTEFDIDDRFELIQFKLDLIQQNSKLFLEVIHHQKAATVEWVIVGLIGVECVLMVLDMSGQGSVMFQYAKNLFV